MKTSFFYYFLISILSIFFLFDIILFQSYIMLWFYYFPYITILLYLFYPIRHAIMIGKLCTFCCIYFLCVCIVIEKNTVQRLTFTWLIWLNILISCFPNYIIFSGFYSFLSFINKWKIMQHPLKLAYHGH